jgi:hypothetical protein
MYCAYVPIDYVNREHWYILLKNRPFVHSISLFTIVHAFIWLQSHMLCVRKNKAQAERKPPSSWLPNTAFSVQCLDWLAKKVRRGAARVASHDCQITNVHIHGPQF